MALLSHRIAPLDPDVVYRGPPNHFYGTARDDTFVGTNKIQNFFFMEKGGDDTVSTTAGTGLFYFGAAFTANDSVTGSATSNADRLSIDQDYQGDFANVVNVESFVLEGTHRYDVTLQAEGARTAVYVTLPAATSAAIDARGITKDIVFKLGSLSGPTIGDATITSGSGDDRFFLNLQSEANVRRIDGGGGVDSLIIASAEPIDITMRLTDKVHHIGNGTLKLTRVENIYTGGGDDRITGNNAANELSGGAGDDTLSGGGGDDVLEGRAGDDLLIGGDGDDVLLTTQYGDNDVSADDNDVFRGGIGNDLLVASVGHHTLYGGEGDDHFTLFVLDGDVIADFQSGDVIDLHGIDADRSTPSRDPLHFGATPGHVGDVVASYDMANDRTVISVYTNGDNVADGSFYLTGQIALTADDFAFT